MSQWSDLARAMAEPWPDLQNDDGTFPDYVQGGQPGVSARYGESMLGYGLLRTGIRENERRFIDAGLRGTSYAVDHPELQRDRPSVFEDLAVASSYNLCRRHLADYAPFQRRRDAWEHWLRRSRMTRLDSIDHFVNKQVVEAAGVLELLRTGVHSSHPDATLGGQRDHARSLAIDLANHRVPAIADHDGVAVDGTETLVLSDPPSYALAYHALSCGMLARVVDRLGDLATSSARDALRQVVRASWWLTAPDGDLAYMGRSQEQAWALPATAYAAEVAAAAPGSDAAEDARFRALSARALQRLRDAYTIGPTGLWIVPALALDPVSGLRGLDHYAGASVYCGLTLVALGWVLDALGGRDVAPGEIGGDAGSAVSLSRGEAELAMVRDDDAWFAVKRACSRSDFPDDLRYDFGLIALKRSTGSGDWHDLLPIRPRTEHQRDSAGPMLLGAGAPAFPHGQSMTVREDGTVVVRGGFLAGDGEWRRRGVSFAFARAGAGAVRLRFDAVAGDRFEYSVFFVDDGGPGPQSDATSVFDGSLRATSTALDDVSFESRYASDAVPKLVRARLALRAAADGPLDVTTGPV
jgi:hypothetical protein